MNFLSSTLLNDDFVWDAICRHIAGRTRRGTGDFIFKMNCPMCVSRGTSADTRYRCGISHSAAGIGINCFNCQFKLRFAVGSRLSKSMESFLHNIGIAEREIKQIKMRAHEFAGFVQTVAHVQPEFQMSSFTSIQMPIGSKTLGTWDAENCVDPDYLDVVRYLLSRGDVAATASLYYWSPDPAHSLNRKLLIPCLHEDRLVGWIGRCIDPTKRKYYTQTPKHFLFNSKFLTIAQRKYIFIVEGVFDALVIDGVAALGGSLNDHQINWINRSDKIPVVIPDRDKAGKYLVQTALDREWAVAFPNYGGRRWWDADIKDVDEAVKRHGRLYTIRSIIASMTADPQQIKVRANLSLL